MMSRERYVVVIGETGSGKSTFINYVANFFYRGTLAQPRIAIPTTYQAANMGYIYNEHSINDRTKSKTVNCQCYSFEFNGITFNFIDTPGVNDTGGYMQDTQNVEKVFSYIENISELAALILVLNGAVARVTLNIKNVLSIYRDRLPDAIYSNIIIVLTNCEEHAVNFNPTNVDLPEQCPVFHMQNSAFSVHPNAWSSAAIRALQKHFDLSMKTINNIVAKLLSLEPTSTKSFRDMSDDRNKIKQQLHLARMTVLDLQNMEDELAAFELSADIHKTNSEKFGNFLRGRKVLQNQRIKTNYHNTICLNCETVCHENCSIEEVKVVGSKTLSHCSAMSAHGHCHYCPNRCSTDKHYHARYIIKKCVVPVVEVVENMQQKFLQARDGRKAADAKCDDLQTSKKLLESALQHQYKEIKESISSLQQTCKDANVTAIIFHFIELLEKDASNLVSDSVVQKSREFIANLKQLCSAPQQINDRQLAICSPSSVNCTEMKSSKHMKPTNYENSLVNNGLSVQDSRYHQDTSGLASPKRECRPLQIQHPPRSTVKDTCDGNNDVFHDACNNEPNSCKHELIDGSRGPRQEETIQPRQDMIEEPIKFKRETEVENIAILPLEELFRLLSNDMNGSNRGEIETELQLRCSGESIGFLTCKEQIVLCEQYVRHQQLKFKDLMRLSIQLIDDVNDITGNDPFKINLVPLEKRLQLSAINLLIKKKD